MTVTKQFIRDLPADIRHKLDRLWDVPQNPIWHPEGNTFKHVFLCIDRAHKIDESSKNLIMAALFHDLGKWRTLAFKVETRQPVAFGHEFESAFEVFRHRKFIKDFGADPLAVFFIVKNHMRMKRIGEMRPSKQNALKNHPAFIELMFFTFKIDFGGF